jgi:disulfide bond formation protein DsbB
VLCWFQRAFLFPLAVVLAIATFRSDYAAWRYALPLAILGWLIAAYHVLLYAGVLPESIEPCGQGPSCTDAAMTVFGVVPIPALSLAAFTIIAGALILVWRRDHE